jgi:peptide/nickel transport system substrate-binding protein
MIRIATSLLLLSGVAISAAAPYGGELRFCLYSEPKTLNPLLVSDTSSEAIRYLTAGVLVRINRATQELQPELAVSWRELPGGRAIAFKLRPHVAYSDGTPFSAADVAHTMQILMDPKLNVPTGEPFRAAGGSIKIDTPTGDEIVLAFPAPIAGLARLFDQVGIVSAKSPKKELASAGPFYVAEYKPGSEVRLARNPNYWKRDEAGRRLPYLESVRLFIQQNREMEAMRFQRGELDLIASASPEIFDQLHTRMPSAMHDLGPSLESEMLWFNQVAQAQIPDYKKLWFRSKEFRRAISAAINREDLCRIVYHGHARPAEGPISPANRFWFDNTLKPQSYDVNEARRRLSADGFRMQGDTLVDAQGHPVEFSLITNAGNQTRELLAQMIQQDLKAIGIRLNVVRLDYSAIIERITKSFSYEACLMGLTNVDLDPDSQMNVWLSSAANHQWNPNQPSPATGWEAEIDRLMRAQNAELNRLKRKLLFDQVQEIVSDQAPFLYLVNKNVLVAISPAIRNASPAALRPQTVWNIEFLSVSAEVAKR